MWGRVVCAAVVAAAAARGQHRTAAAMADAADGHLLRRCHDGMWFERAWRPVDKSNTNNTNLSYFIVLNLI